MYDSLVIQTLACPYTMGNSRVSRKESLIGAFFVILKGGWIRARGAYSSIPASTPGEAGASPAGSIHLETFSLRGHNGLVRFCAQEQVAEREERGDEEGEPVPGRKEKKHDRHQSGREELSHGQTHLEEYHRPNDRGFGRVLVKAREQWKHKDVSGRTRKEVDQKHSRPAPGDYAHKPRENREHAADS